nr:P3 protein [Alfalfa dwarf virus]
MPIRVGSTSYTLDKELVVGAENGEVPLTKTLSLFQRATMLNAKNYRIKQLRFIYKPRTGSLGEGTIETRVKDNRIDSRISDPVINRFRFDASASADLKWESSFWIPKDDFKSGTKAPIILETDVLECNLQEGYSIGMLSIVVSVSASDTMDNFIYRRPSAEIREDPFKILAVGGSSSAQAKFVQTPVQRMITHEPKEASEDAEMKSHLRAIARDSVGSRSSRMVEPARPSGYRQRRIREV